MGYSCTAAASKTEEIWNKACVAQTGGSNTFMERGARYFYERGRENEDGAITGTIYRFVQQGEGDYQGQTDTAYRVGSYRIEPDGSVARAPRFLKAASKTRDEWLRADPANREAALRTGA